jgi:DNA-directed RNA polymerase specialized sigma24 family protein
VTRRTDAEAWALALANRRLAGRMASRWPQMDQDELTQELVIALWRAARTWDPGRAQFSTWAWKYMRAHLRTMPLDLVGSRHPRRGRTPRLAPRVLPLDAPEPGREHPPSRHLAAPDRDLDGALTDRAQRLMLWRRLTAADRRPKIRAAFWAHVMEGATVSSERLRQIMRQQLAGWRPEGVCG